MALSLRMDGPFNSDRIGLRNRNMILAIALCVGSRLPHCGQFVVAGERLGDVRHRSLSQRRGKLPMIRTPSEAKLFALLRFQARLTLMLANHRAPKRRRQHCCERIAALDVDIAQARAAIAKEIRERINTVTPTFGDTVH
jgi:hypothetical protein